MSEWWTYRASSFLMFSPRTYAGLVERYNADVWPAQPLAVALGLAALVLAWRARSVVHDRCIWLMLGSAWLWVGWAFHLQRFAAINWAAEYVGWAFCAQGLALLWVGAVRARIGFRRHASAARVAGGAIVVFALLAYPLLGAALGRPWAQAETFGVMSDPTVIATLGWLLLARRSPWWLMVVPLTACALSGALSSALRVPAAWLVPALAGVVAGLAVWRWHASRARP